jgi:hypothetical protein
MKRIPTILALLACSILLSGNIFATPIVTIPPSSDANSVAHVVNVSIPEVFLVDIEPSNATTISLAPSAPTEAGLGLDFSGATNNSLWLNYSSIVENATHTRKVTVQITNGTVPSGVDLKVSAAAAAGGTGTVGTPTGTITLSTLAQDFVTGIGSCYTGDGTSKGHNLTYSFALQAGNYNKVYSVSTTPITVTYTITN